MTDVTPRIDQRVSKVCVYFAAMVGLLVALVGAGLLSAPAQAHCVPSSANDIEVKLNDRFHNFDYRDNTSVGDCNVDWPMDFLFWDNATKWVVKTRMESLGYDNEGDRMYGKLDDSSGWAWDSDPGRKNFSLLDCRYGDMEHFRLYAVYDDNRMYNVDWGYYVLGTAHIDHHECGDGAWSGESETAEERIANDIQNAGQIGLGEVREDSIAFHNHLDFAVADDGHHKENSGGGTKVNVRP